MARICVKREFLRAARIGFGKRLKARREEVGLTQERLGQLLGVKQKNISEWESGLTEPEDIDRLVLLATTLQAGVGWLVNGESPNPKRYVVPAEPEEPELPTMGHHPTTTTTGAKKKGRQA